jgi:hypothetical protein
MPEPKQRRAEQSAGAFLGPDLLVPAPIRTLSDEYRDEPTEPEDSERIPEPVPPSRVRRVIDRLGRRRSR